MAKPHQSYKDAKGVTHDTLERATLADLAIVLGGGDEASRLASLFYAKRDEIEAVLAEHDELMPASKALRLVKP